MLVWYHIEEDIVFTSRYVDSMFYSLQPLNYDMLVLLGEL